MKQVTDETVEKIRKALKGTSSLIVVETWCPPEHKFEIEQRHQVREAVQKMAIDALHDLLVDIGELPRPITQP